MGKHDRLNRDQKRKAKLKKRAERSRKHESLAYTGKTYKTDEYAPIFYRTEVGGVPGALKRPQSNEISAPNRRAFDTFKSHITNDLALRRRDFVTLKKTRETDRFNAPGTPPKIGS
ncbi:MAG: hypothetical protein JO252_29905 [Planctomycetaceae bacterium]|nr:hypothetical protein [Planctomycetaceae bacterium]